MAITDDFTIEQSSVSYGYTVSGTISLEKFYDCFKKLLRNEELDNDKCISIWDD